MSATQESARINLRTSPEAKALIERAAALMDTTVSSFLLQNAYETARRVVADHDNLVLSAEAFDAFIAAGGEPTSGHSDKGNTKAVWIYDLRANMPQYGKRRTHPSTLRRI